MKKIRYLTVLLLMALAGCSVAERPMITNDMRMKVIERFYAQRKELAAEVEYKRYLRDEENK